MDAVPFHIGVATDDLARSMKELGAALGVSWTTPRAGEGEFTGVDGRVHPRPLSCVSLQGPIHIDLMQGAPGTLWESRAPTLHHFAYWTDDLAGDVERLAGEGWRLELTRPDAEGRPTLFAYLVRADGFRLELIDSAGRADYQARL
jgi:hypothetical protein